MEIWASPEPTVARIDRHTHRDQLIDTGHAHRLRDIDLLADLGISATRYPVLWERVAPFHPEVLDTSWADPRIALLNERNVDPIITLLHHGSGPRYTSLVDECFPQLLARYAGKVAQAYPHVQRWTPINEPTTTARFSTLYGSWYPNHSMNHEAFGKAIYNQALGTLLAMEAIREHIPEAQLVYTDDLQHYVAGDRDVAAYVTHKCERMYLSAELLMGRLLPGHPLWQYLTSTCNLPASDLFRLAERAQPPQLIGLNYYANSERYLKTLPDGSIGNFAKVDILGQSINPRPLLQQAYQRLGLPIALSEIHIAGSAEERVCWFLDRYHDAHALRNNGVPFMALGLWAAFGLVDWRSLLRKVEGCHEDGVYTMAGSHGIPEATALSRAVQMVTAGQIPLRPAITPWWESPGHAQPLEAHLENFATAMHAA